MKKVNKEEKKLRFINVLNTFSNDELPENLNDFIAFFENIKDVNKGKYVELKIEFDYEYEYYSSDRSTKMIIVGYSEESDADFKIRMDKNKKIAESVKIAAQKRKTTLEQKEKELFEKLKQKYEGTE